MQRINNINSQGLAKVSQSTQNVFSPFRYCLLSMIVYFVIVLSLCLNSAEASCPRDVVDESCFREFECKGIYNSSMYERVHDVCKEYYGMFHKSEIFDLCRDKCFTTPYFDICLESIERQNETAILKEYIGVLNNISSNISS